MLLVVLSFEGLLTKGEAWSSSLPRGQQILPNSQGGGLLMAFPEGKKESKLDSSISVTPLSTPAGV